VHHDVSLLAAASQARHAPGLSATELTPVLGCRVKCIVFLRDVFLRLLCLFAAIVSAFKDQSELRTMNRQMPTQLTQTTADRALDPAARRDIIVGVLLAMFLAALDQTIVAPALPTIGSSLGNAEYLSWIVTA
jgi:hypothetical protein